MVVSLAGVLLRAHGQAAWNRIRRESGLTGSIGTALALGVVALIISLPAAFVLRLGWSIGTELRGQDPRRALAGWNGLQTLFTVVFPLLGAVRYKPAFGRRDIGMHPIPALSLLFAEIPGSVAEVFPLLAAAGILASHVGLAIALPRASPAIALLAVNGLLTMLALQVMTGDAWRFVRRHPLVGAGIGASLWASVVLLGLKGMRRLVVVGTAWLPWSQASAGLIRAIRGDGWSALGLIVGALGATAALVVAAAWSHYGETMSEATVWRLRRTDPRPVRFARASAGIARLFVRQVLGTRLGRFQMLAPLLYSVPWAVVLPGARMATDSPTTLPPVLVPLAQWALSLPFFGLFLCLVVPLGAEIWTNQFGVDRAAVRTLLVLPISSRSLVVGRALGLLELSLLEAAVGALPLLLVYRPSAMELIWGGAAFGTTFLVAAALGLVFSVRFPRAVSSESASNMPLFLSWVPTAAMVAVHALLFTIKTIAGTPLVFLVVFAASALLYAVALPVLAGLVARNQERLLEM